MYLQIYQLPCGVCTAVVDYLAAAYVKGGDAIHLVLGKLKIKVDIFGSVRRVC